MKIYFLLILLAFFFFGCNSTKVFFDTGSVITNNEVEVIAINYTNNLPFCFVRINGKEYRFLIDTGAPTVISEEIFEEINLETNHSANVGDSQNKNQKLKLAVLPSIKIGNLEFKDIGSVVFSIEDEVLKCHNFDGIIGSNLMSKLFWKFDYQNNKIFISKKLSDFEVETYDYALSFNPRNSKTPVIEGEISDKKLSFTFDTGFNGNIKVSNDYEFYKNNTSEKNFITRSGVSSIGLFGSSDKEKTFIMKTDFQIESQVFANELVASGSKTLIGNKFLKDYVFVIDWVDNEIYFRRNLNVNPKIKDGFGFSYQFIDNRFKVVSIIEEANIPILVDDEILKINDIDYTKIDSIEVCDFILNKREKGLNEIDVKIKRNNDTLSYRVQKKVFIK